MEPKSVLILDYALSVTSRNLVWIDYQDDICALEIANGALTYYRTLMYVLCNDT